MLKKAFKITADNQKRLASKFGITVVKDLDSDVDPDLNDRIPVGYYLVTDFGNEENFDILSNAVLRRDWYETGVKLTKDVVPGFEIGKKP